MHRTQIERNKRSRDKKQKLTEELITNLMQLHSGPVPALSPKASRLELAVALSRALIECKTL
jgi:hypothetical protein